MSNQIFIQIPEPCHENWDKMLPAQQGRYCESCCKTVVDFELLSDQEVLNYFAKNTGKICGRFNTQQLNRPLEVTTVIPRKLNWQWTIASIFSLLMAACKNDGEKTSTKKENTEKTISTTETFATTGVIVVAADEIKEKSSIGEPVIEKPQFVETTTKGDIYIQEVQKIQQSVPIEPMIEPLVDLNSKNELQFLITDSVGHTLENVFLQVLNAKNSQQFYSNKEGVVLIDKKGLDAKSPLKINISLVGYENKIQDIPLSESDTTIRIVLKNAASNLPDVVVVSAALSVCRMGSIGGGVQVVRCKKVTKVDLLKQNVKNTFLGKPFTAFPNPATKGSLVTLSFKTAGNFTVNLIDNNGRYYSTQNINVNTTNEDFKIQLPSTLSSGIYYLVAINKLNNKQEIEKIVVQ